jgi:CheY-like chemotaxis protein
MAKVLVIDDSKFSRNRTTAALKEAGHEVIEVGDGEQGLRAATESAPDCVVLDMLMPVMDGPEVLRRLREGGSRLPVVMLTADIQASSRALCEELGVSGFLNKPLRADELRRCLDQILNPNKEGLACH